MTDLQTEDLANSFLHSLGVCFVYGCLVGLAISGGVMGLILLTSAVQATEVDSVKQMSVVRQLSALESGQLVFRQSDGNYLVSPGVSTAVEIDINGLLSRVKLSQTFTNSTLQWQEGIYVFPLPETAAIDHLWMKIGERVIEGDIQPRKQARKIYQQAKAAGKRTSLVEQQRPNMFTTSVANIAPGDDITIIIEYQQTVTVEQNDFSVRFPMVVAPRYIPGTAIQNTEEISHFNGAGWAVNTDQVPDASHITPAVVISKDEIHNPINIQVTLAAGFTLDNVVSRYHQIEQVTLENGTRKITLIDVVPANRDFELVWQAKAQQAPQAALFKQDKAGQQYAMVMLTPPKQLNVESIARELIFVIDTSGSMDGTSIKQAKSALQYGLGQLRSQDSFNIIQFSDDVDSLFRQAKLATQGNVDIAYDYVNWLRAGGGTEMAPALKLALSSETAPAEKRLRQVVFLTDGSVGNEDELFTLIKQHLGNSRLFTVGIGSAPNSHFMLRAARYGRGSHSYIGNQADVKQKMTALFNKMSHPVLMDIKLNIADSIVVEQWPQVIPDLYMGEPLMLTLKADVLPDEISIGGLFGVDPWQQTVTLKGGGHSEAVSVLWARRKIEGLMDRYRLTDQDNQVKSDIVEVALAHHLVSKFTSLVAVDKTPVRRSSEQLYVQKIASNMPAGWTMGQLPQTATAASLQILIGFISLFSALLLRRRKVCR
ncbi:MAG: marine proteobacterial sortase target protein [Methylophaga sp.]|nr:MAG: marine proteobacterial sortase target protein [Methylophaga sp.]